MSSSSGWVKLNVGGKLFETSLRTVTKYPDSVLAKIFDDNDEEDDDIKMTEEEKGVCNIDCDPEVFKIILQWLR